MEEVVSALTGRTARWGVRKSSVAVAVGVVAGALLLGGLLLLVVLQSSLTVSTNTAARQKAQSVIAELEEVDVSDANEYMLATARAGQYVQLLDPTGIVVGSSDPVAAYSPLSAQRPGPGQTLTQDASSLPTLGDSDNFHIVASGSPGGYTVVVAQSTQLRADTIATVAWFMLGTTPLLLAIVAGSVWLLVGRSLRQVETIRGQVAKIDAERLDGRVDVPPTKDELEALALTMNTMLARLQASDHEQRRFVSDASHELRSPLATLSAGIEIAASDPSGAMWLQMQDVLAQETARMSYLVESLLTLAKANDHGLTLEETDVDLDDVVDQEIRRLRSTSRNEIRAEIAPARIRGDAHRLAQVLRNVLDNAERHARSRITIRLDSTDGAAVVTVDNDGTPVPEADRERIFERFVRLDASRSRESGGSGLGLAIAAGIMTAHRGRIRATDGPDGQCRFEMTLPAAGHDPAPARAPRGSRRPRPTAPSRR